MLGQMEHRWCRPPAGRPKPILLRIPWLLNGTYLGFLGLVYICNYTGMLGSSSTDSTIKFLQWLASRLDNNRYMAAYTHAQDLQHHTYA